jgi:hypothetical protein
LQDNSEPHCSNSHSAATKPSWQVILALTNATASRGCYTAVWKRTLKPYLSMPSVADCAAPVVLCSALLEGSSAEGAWDYEVGGPCVVPMAASRYRLYYSGRSRDHSESASNTVTANCDAGEGTDTDQTQDSQHRDDPVAQHGQEAIGKPWQGFGLALTPQEESRSEGRFEGLRTDFERLGP